MFNYIMTDSFVFKPAPYSSDTFLVEDLIFSKWNPKSMWLLIYQVNRKLQNLFSTIYKEKTQINKQKRLYISSCLYSTTNKP